MMMREADLPIADVDGRWWLLHTKPRNEKALASDLCDIGIDCFLPMLRQSRKYGRRRVEIDIPLFSGYVFASCVSENDRYRVLATKRIASIINIADQERIKKELEQVRQAIASPHKVGLFPGIRRGRRCRVVHGSLKGLDGVVVRRSGAGRIYLDVAMLGQSAVVDIDVAMLELAD